MWWVALAWAGGAPRNAMVVFNDALPGAGDVAAHYLDARPGAGSCPVSVDPSIVDIPYADFVSSIRDPLDACLASHPDVDYLVTVRGLPYRVILPAWDASLEAVLQVGHAVDGTGVEVAGSGQEAYSYFFVASLENPAFISGFAEPGDYLVSNPYQLSYEAAPGVVREDPLPRAFHRASSWDVGDVDYTGQLFIVGRLDGFDLDDADALIDRAVAAESVPPSGVFTCMHGADDARGARDPECEFTTRMLASAGFDAEWVDAFDGALAGRDLAALLTGAEDVRGAIDGNTWEPGAIADNLTSFGAVPGNFACSDDGLTCPAVETQTSVARFVRAGATGVHGTVDEPLNNSFPAASALLFYTFGYSAGESWLFAQHYLHWENLYLGDPLVSPWAVRPVVVLPQGDELASGQPVVVTATHPDGIASIALWVDGAQVASVDDALELDWTPDDTSEHALYAEAIAADVDVARPGWPSGAPRARPSVVGWAYGSARAAAPAPAAAEPDRGCGCASGGPTRIPTALLLLVLRRRRLPRSSARHR